MGQASGRRNRGGGKTAEGSPSRAGDVRDDAARRFGTRSLSALLPRIVRPAFRRRSAATATLLTDWAAIVGPADAAVAAPLRLAAGVLTIACDGPTALELQHREGGLIDRINLRLGETIVRRIRIVQGAAPDTATPPVPAPRPSRSPPPPVPDAPDGPLGDALARLRAAMTRAGR